MIRRLLRSKLLWFSLLGFGFVAWSWIVSMQGTRGVSWRSGNRSLFLAVSDGSVRLGYEGKAIRESGFGQWSVRKGEYSRYDVGWFVPGGIRPYESFKGWIVTIPHWLLVLILIGFCAGLGWLERRGRRKAGELPKAIS